MKLSTLVMAAAIAAFATTAGAAAKPPKFKVVDANGDGGIDASEFVKATEAGVTQKFEKLDKNGDGKLSKGEYSVVMGEEDCE